MGLLPVIQILDDQSSGLVEQAGFTTQVQAAVAFAPSDGDEVILGRRLRKPGKIFSC